MPGMIDRCLGAFLCFDAHVRSLHRCLLDEAVVVFYTDVYLAKLWIVYEASYTRRPDHLHRCLPEEVVNHLQTSASGTLRQPYTRT